MIKLLVNLKIKQLEFHHQNQSKILTRKTRPLRLMTICVYRHIIIIICTVMAIMIWCVKVIGSCLCRAFVVRRFNMKEVVLVPIRFRPVCVGIVWFRPVRSGLVCVDDNWVFEMVCVCLVIVVFVWECPDEFY